MDFKILKTDNGCEFVNKEVSKWCEEREIEHKTAIPYCHSSNGRIERAIQTLRTALKKTDGIFRLKLAAIIKNYNSTIHRAIGMTPNEASKPENRDDVIKNGTKYAKEFGKQTKTKLHIGDIVLIKNERKQSKNDKNFIQEGQIVEKLDENTFAVLTDSGSSYKRHSSQLRLLSRGDVGSGDPLD